MGELLQTTAVPLRPLIVHLPSLSNREVFLAQVKTDGVVHDVELQDLIATWKEGSLYKEWVPTCYVSDVLKDIGRQALQSGEFMM